ncbi:MAG: hypothetical protein U5K77_00995 [Candidatus Saccharibacteria bacterium]|nr:hypothetical protein [Candidatus Saccharibacteria bacterium]
MAVASSGTNRVMTSPDGETWTARTAAEANSWRSVTYGNGTFVAVSWEGTPAPRHDLPRRHNLGHPRHRRRSWRWQSVTYGNGQFVAVASSGTNHVMTSQTAKRRPPVPPLKPTTGAQLPMAMVFMWL